jgi:hypothetical protein
MNIQVKINIMFNLPEFLTGFCADEQGGIESSAAARAQS